LLPLTTLTAISPIDGRYFKTTNPIASYFSEFGLIRYRVRVEVEYFISLSAILPELKSFPENGKEELIRFYEELSDKDALAVKEIEAITNHDVKAVEYFIKKFFEQKGWDQYKEFIHFGLTSQDINNTAVPLSIKEFLETELLPQIDSLTAALADRSKQWENIAMLARTHGQPASPTRLGKEIAVFLSRINQQVELLKGIPHAAKFGGATGNFNAHHVAYPEIAWSKFANDFISRIGLTRSTPTTQIEHYDHFAAQCDNLKRINTILIDFGRDMWQYISMNYFTQKIKPGEVGSSAMPHKVNPIDFENAEGNLGVANALFEHFAAKLPISRLQRDLTDSTVLRNVGVPLAHTSIALRSLLIGLEKVELNKPAIDSDLEANWAVVAEGIQTILRRAGYPNPYEALKELTRKNEKITKESMAAFVDKLDVSDAVKKQLRNLTPFNYTGV
jgi:adenylosuccinate lyase